MWYLKGEVALSLEVGSMKRVLIVENSLIYQGRYRKELEGKVELIMASTLAHARSEFGAYPSFDLIVVDTCLEVGYVDTEPLVREFRKTHTGPLIAASYSEYFRKKLVVAGCDYEAGKKEVPSVVLTILGI